MAQRLRARLGAENVLTGPATPLAAPIAAFPGSEGDAREAVSIAAEAGMAVLPCGGGTYADALAPAAPDALLLSTARLNRVVEYHADDLVITVEAGLPIAALQDVLRKKRQFLPLDPPNPETATVGGMVASASTGAWRAAYGSPRDYVLEVRVVDALGRAVRGGARVVKNVAGYDLPKLYTGSRGTLAFLTQVTLKVRPLPEETARLLVTAPSWVTIHERIAALAASDIRPAVMEIVRADLRDARERPSATITLEGGAETVAWQTAATMELLRGAGATVGRVPFAPELPRGGDVEIAVRVRPSDTLETMAWLAANGWRGAAGCRPAEGDLTLRGAAYPDTPQHLAALRSFIEPRGGTATVERMPRSWIGVVDPWGAPRPDAFLARALKSQLDPENVFRAVPYPGL